MSLRVIAGKARGMKLKAVPGERTRPIMDRVKEALFSIIGGGIREASFLDLFAGTGSVGIEALSRGAQFAHFVELDRRAVNTIRGNLAHTRLASSARVIRGNAFDILARPPARHFHFIYVAPPQYRQMWLRTLELLDDNAAWQQPNSQVIVQIDPAEYLADLRFQNLRAFDRRRYGRTMLIFYQFLTPEAEPEDS